MFHKMCRLCLGTNDLLWVFDKKISDNMKEIILVTSGVEISKTDSVSQMVCSTCCQITIKMYKFRTTSIKNDKDLKAQCAGYNVSQLTNSSLLSLCTNEETPSTIKLAKKNQITMKTLPAKYRFAHPSIKDIVMKYPNIKLPNECLKSHVGAYITLLSDEVDDWYLEKNVSPKEIKILKRQALEVTKETKPLSKKRRKSDGAPTQKSEITAQNRPNGTMVKKIKTETIVNPTKKIKLDKSDEEIVPSPPNPVVNEKLADDEEKSKIMASQVAEKKMKKELKPKNKQNFESIAPSSSDKNVAEVSECVQNSEKSKTPNSSEDSSTSAKSLSILGSLLTSEVRSSNEYAEEEITLTSILQSSKGKSRRKQQLNVLTNDDMEFERRSASPVQNPTISQNRFEKEDTSESDESLPSRPITREILKILIAAPQEENQPENEPTFANTTSSVKENAEKSTFIEALNLAPNENTPDFSLFSISNKTSTLYTCKVCDSQHSNLKDLKLHMKRTHTKCPFCRKRFKTSQLRDEHVKNTCIIKQNPIELKVAKLELVKVDEVKELREKYHSAFEFFKKKSSGKSAEKDPRSVNNKSQSKKSENVEVQPSMMCDKETEEAVLELEKFLNMTERADYSNGVFTRRINRQVNFKKTDRKKGGSDDIICISDDEREEEPNKIQQTKKSENTDCNSQKPQIKIVDSEVLQNIDTEASDLEILKSIIQNRTKANTSLKDDSFNINDNPIVDGSSNRVKVFKNLRKHLMNYKIPIEVKYNPTVSVDYKPTKTTPRYKVLDLWTSMTPIDVKPNVLPKQPIQSPKNKVTVLNGQQMMSILKPNQQKIIYDGLYRKMPQDGVVPTTNLVISGTSVVSNTGTTTTNPILLNAFLVRNSMLSLKPVVTTLPSQPGPLPVIQSISSVQKPNDRAGAVTTLATISNGMMTVTTVSAKTLAPATTVDSAVQPSTSSCVQSGPPPAIRVKNLSELS